MTGRVLDAAYPRWSIEQLVEWLHAGRLAGVMRYVGDASNGKNITPDECHELLAANVPFGLVYETSGTDYTGGGPAGAHAGSVARANARRVGFPDSRPIYSTVDRGDHASPLIVQYQAAYNSSGGAGPGGGAFYGDGDLAAMLFAHGLIRWHWQPGARAWPGDAIDDPRAALIQRTSASFPELPRGTYDENDVFASDWGQVPAPAVHPLPPPKPPTAVVTEYEDDGEMGKQADVRIDRLDEHGNGHVELKPPLVPETVASSRVKGLFHLAVRPPETAGKYDPIPKLSLTLDAQHDSEVVIEGGLPLGACTFRVTWV